jgi:hypothetical protein
MLCQPPDSRLRDLIMVTLFGYARATLRQLNENEAKHHRSTLSHAGRPRSDVRQLIVDPAEADTVRVIVQFNRHGDGRSGPIGVKPICRYGNEGG